MPEDRTRYDTVSIVLHWSVGISIIAIAAIEILRGEVFPKGSYFREALKAFHDPAGTVVFALVLLRLFWRSAHSSPAMPGAWAFGKGARPGSHTTRCMR